MVFRLIGAKPLSEPMHESCQLDAWEHISIRFESKYNIFYQINMFENVVCEMAAIFHGLNVLS